MKIFNKLLLLGATDLQITGTDVKDINEVSTAIVSLFEYIRNFGLVIALIFGAFQVFQFIISSGQEKMQHLKTLGLTLFGVIILILLPSLINFLVSFFA